MQVILQMFMMHVRRGEKVNAVRQLLLNIVNLGLSKLEVLLLVVQVDGLPVEPVCGYWE